MRLVLSLLIFGTFWSPTFSQEKCGTVEYNQKLGIVDETQFQNWISEKIKIKRQFNSAGNRLSTKNEIYTIPLVVHVIHNGENEGIGANIPEGQVLNQIETLNLDFRRQNADASETPTIFQPVAADIEIEFVLAKRDPEGLPTNGIVRIQGPFANYSMTQDDLIKGISYWPADEYLNVWVAPLAGGQLGWAQYPMSNLQGMNIERKANGLTDGVVIDYEYFGTGFNTDNFSKGRTATHEIGHWLGLRHIWADGGCSVDDYCDDTPTQGSSTSGCPDPSSLGCFNEIKMFQNYMDYTDDICMNVFTVCQSDRMRIVTENSPRRKSLLSSPGGTAPPQVENDLGIKSILTPTAGNCATDFRPSVQLRNYGTNQINNFQVEVLINDVSQEVLNFTETLAPLDVFAIDFSSVGIQNGLQTVAFKIIEVNGLTDGNIENDCEWISANFPASETIPFSEGFDNSTSEPASTHHWTTKNDDGSNPLWSYAVAPNLDLDNEAAVLNFFNTTPAEFGKVSYLMSPVLDFTGFVALDLNFQYAYASRTGVLAEALIVAVSTDCGATFLPENVIFEAFPPGLATTNSMESEFVPNGPGDWQTINLNLSEFVGNEHVVIAFIGQNGNGNNLYLDDIEILSENSDPNDVALVDIMNLSPASCIDGISSLVEVKNTGTNMVNSYTIRYSHDNGTGTVEVDGAALSPGKSKTEHVIINDIVDGFQNITFLVENPNGVTDPDPSNNSATRNFTLSNDEETIPLRETFNRSIENSSWVFSKPDAAHDWSITNTASSQGSAFLNGFENTTLGTENWLISPILDFSQTDKASVFFDLSYASRTGKNDRMKVFASTTCGQAYNIELYNKQGIELALKQSEIAWEPSDESDWKREYINLNELAGNSSVRLAFVITNQNGNNLYLDNIEFYIDDDEDPIVAENPVMIYPNPVSMGSIANFNIAINFNHKDDVKIRITSLSGEVMYEDQFDNTLNQVYEVRNLAVRSGIYLVNVIGAQTNITRKVVIN